MSLFAIFDRLEDYSWVVGALVLMLIFVLFAVAGILVVRVFIGHRSFHMHHEVAGIVYTNLGVLYGVLLGFTVVNVQQRFDAVQKTTEVEAAYLAQLYGDAEVFAEKDRLKIRKRLQAYAEIVVNVEWKVMEQNQTVMPVRKTLEDLWDAYYNINPETKKQEIWYAESVTKLNNMMSARLERLMGGMESLSSEMWTLLIGGALVMMGFLWFFGLDSLTTHILMSVILAGCTAFMLFLIYSLDTAYSGSVSVQPDAFERVLKFFVTLKLIMRRAVHYGLTIWCYLFIATNVFTIFSNPPGVNADPRYSFEAMIRGEASRPYTYRWLTPWLTRAMSAVVPDPLFQDYEKYRWHDWIERELERTHTPSSLFKEWILYSWLAILCFAGLGWALHSLLDHFYPESALWSHLWALLGLSFLPILFDFHGQMYDPVSALIFPLAFLAMVKERRLIYYSLLLLAMLNKETSCLLILFYLIYSWRERRWLDWLGQGMVYVLVTVGIRWLYRHHAGEALESQLVNNRVFPDHSICGFAFYLDEGGSDGGCCSNGLEAARGVAATLSPIGSDCAGAFVVSLWAFCGDQGLFRMLLPALPARLP